MKQNKFFIILTIILTVSQLTLAPISILAKNDQDTTEDKSKVEQEEVYPMYDSISNNKKEIDLVNNDEPIVVIDKDENYYQVQLVDTDGMDRNTFFVKANIIDDKLLSNVSFSPEFQDNYLDESDGDEDKQVEDSESDKDEDKQVKDPKSDEDEDKQVEDPESDENKASEKNEEGSSRATLTNQNSFTGIALKNKTSVYTKTSTSSKILKSYAEGSGLKYRSYSDEWYEASVKVNGKYETGYIHKSHVDNPQSNKQSTYQGIALKDKTAVYESLNTNSKKLKTYAEGSILKYKSFSDNWYEATVKVNGKYETGYIHKSHVENAKTSNQDSLRGIAQKSKTHVYAKASTKSSKLKSYKKGSILRYKSFSSNWYEATVYINGEKTKGYIHKSHVSESIESHYDISLEDAAEAQKKANAQTDQKYAYVHKDYIKNNKVTASALNVRSGPGSNHKQVGQLKKNDKVTILGTDGNWHQIKFSGKEQWVNASAEDISYYLDPDNFINDSIQKFQFLDLSRPSGASKSSFNTYLSGMGILAGHGQAFMNAGKKHNVNDAYLLSHALLETGNGSSELANGNEVGLNSSGKATFVTKSNRKNLTKIKTVYNMYGIGAVDGDALKGGSIRAYEEGWTTPEKAIVGGAKFIGKQYIHGENNTNTVQNTLYKMRWNPEHMAKTNNAGHQYATDIGWASKQVSRIANIYKKLGNDFIVLDIPIYNK